MSGSNLFQEEIFNEALIDEVQKYRCLYNHNDPDYGNPDLHNKLWSEIAKNVGSSTAFHCKERWKDLQQKYVDEYMSADEVMSDWVHFEAMEPMKEYILSETRFTKAPSDSSKKDAFCRACLRLVLINTDKICTTYNIFDTESFCEKFMQCTNLQADVNDAYPHSVCIDCYAKVLDFYQFSAMCHETLDKFNILLESRAAKNYEIISDGNLQTFDNKTVSVPADVEIVDSLLTEEKCDNQPQTLDASVNDFEETPGDDPLAEHLDTDINLEEHCTKSITTKSTKTRQKTPKRRIAKIEIKKPKAEVVADEEYLTESSDDRSLSEDIEKSAEDNEENIHNKAILKCDVCPKTFHVQHCLDAHRRRHQGLSGYPCSYANCDKAYNRYTDLNRHLNDHNGIPNLFECDIENCQKVFSCYSSLNYHKREYHKCGKEIKRLQRQPSTKSFVCESCGQVLSSRATLKTHRYIHVDKSQWPYVCDEPGCTRRFRMASRLTIHKKRHAGIKDFVCPHCGMRKTTRHELNIHINFHTFERKYPCRICSKVFKSVGMVSTHIHKAHEGRDVKARNDGCFDCSYCDRKLSTLQNKIFHEMTHTGEKPHACQECGKTFGRPANLKQHMHMHLKGEKPYACKECGEKFKWPGPWKIHMKLHSEDKAHVCDVCGKRFKWSSNLISHKKLHEEGATPYVCGQCGQGFRWPGSYYTHKKKHDGQKIESVPREDNDAAIQSKRAETKHVF